MTLYDYRESQRIAVEDYQFYALIMAAMRQADTDNATKLKFAFPFVWEELRRRYNAPGGFLPGEEDIALPSERPTEPQTNIVRDLRETDRFIP